MKINIIGMVVCLLFLSLMGSSVGIAAVGNDTDDTTIVSKDTIAFNGTCSWFLHIRYHKICNTQVNPDEDIYRIGMSFILFEDADILINDGEMDAHGSGVLFLFHYRGEYDLDYDERSLVINGNALFIHVKIE